LVTAILAFPLEPAFGAGMKRGGLNLPAEAKHPPKFDEQKFFNHLMKHADRDRALLVLLRSIDKRASVEISHLIFRYLRPLENSLRAKRKERGNKIEKSQKAALDSMLEATRKYRELAAIEIPGHGSAIGDAPKCADGTLLLPYILESEAVRIALQLGKAKKIYNEKRFGLSAYHLWLVILEEFVSLCTEKELGKAQALAN
jgi:hypothetical protein